MTRRLLKYGNYLLRSIELFVAFLYLYLLNVLFFQSITIGEIPSGNIPMYVVSNGVHTDICLPTTYGDFDWRNIIPTEDFEQIQNDSFVRIGWGDKGFYIETREWSELKVSTALNAVFVPSETAMHVQYIGKLKESKDCILLQITPIQYRQLCDFALASFEMKNSQTQLIPNQGYSTFDNFYEANSSYHLFKTCNTWTNNALKSAGIKTSIRAYFPDGILTPLENI